MTLQAILERIRAVGEAQVQEIEKNASAEVNDILARARMDAGQIQEDASSQASAPAIAERARILHRARLDALQIIGSIREDLVDTAIMQTREHLASFRSDPAYPEVLHTLTMEALTQLTASEREGTSQLLADPRDKKLMQKILKDLKLDIPVRYELTCWGGLTAQSEDGRVVVINTLESRLKHAQTFLHPHLAALFKEEKFEEAGMLQAIAE